jgi:hypothetical protein
VLETNLCSVFECIHWSAGQHGPRQKRKRDQVSLWTAEQSHPPGALNWLILIFKNYGIWNSTFIPYIFKGNTWLEIFNIEDSRACIVAGYYTPTMFHFKLLVIIESDYFWRTFAHSRSLLSVVYLYLVTSSPICF